MFEPLDEKHGLKVIERLVRALNETTLRAPLLNETEQRYVASALVPVVQEVLSDLKGLTLHGEGLQRAAPAHFLGYHMYPDLAVMHYSQRLVAMEAKYVDFSLAKGALSTAIGQTVIYARAGYLTSLGILVGVHGRDTRSAIEKENAMLAKGNATWRLCSPYLTQA